jgi:predicted RNase H-like HicB family nuclease
MDAAQSEPILRIRSAPLALYPFFIQRAPMATSYGVLFEKLTEAGFPPGYYYAHVPALALTTNGLGIEGAREAALDLVQLWIAEKKTNGEPVPPASECFFSTLEIPDHALQST